LKGKTCGLFLGILIFITGILTCQLKGTILPPERYSVTAGEPLRLKLPAFVENNLEARIIGNEYESLSKSINPEELKSGTIPLSSQFGQQIVRLTLFGVLPVRDMIVSIVPEVRVIPGGQSIGVLLHSQGIVVVDSYEIQDETGRKINPAAEAGIMKNDHILRIGGENVISDSQVRDLAAKAGAAGQPLIMEVKRGDKVFLVRLKPVFCKETRRYKIGLMIRDSAAGVGTLTFYDPMTMSYGALGHTARWTWVTERLWAPPYRA
jgi:stage IV sporulation protein B